MVALTTLGAPAHALSITHVPQVARIAHWNRYPSGGIWKRADQVRHLIQQSPNPGVATPFKTSVRILRTRASLYVAFFNHDPTPQRIEVHTLFRDGHIGNDDHVTLVLQPGTGGQETGYVFQVNAGGARRDGVIAPERNWPYWEWNGLWQARVWRRSWGWVALLRIPFSTLRFSPREKQWRLNFARYVARRQLVLTWVGHSYNSNVFDLQQSGALSGMRGARAKSHWFMTPYVAVSAGHQGASQKVGATVRGILSPSITAVLTARPDFAEAELPPSQLNLSPYPLYIAETRPFFLQGSSLFDFSPGLGDRLIPFYSRQIGQVNGVVVPINVGAKLVGRAGPTSLGLLDVQTASGAGVGPQNLFAGAIGWPLGGGLRVGGVLTHGDPTGQTRNTFLGVDAAWQTDQFLGSQNLQASVWGAQSENNLTSGSPTGWGARISYPNDRWQWDLDYNRFGQALYPALGFLPQPGTRMVGGGFSFKPRPRRRGPFGWAQQFYFQLYGHYTADPNGRLLDWHFFVSPFNVRFPNGASVEVDWMPHFIRLTDAFDLTPSVIFPTGDYRYTRYQIQADSPAGRYWHVGGALSTGGFYDGRMTQVVYGASYETYGGHWSISINGESDFGQSAQGPYVLRLYGLGLTWARGPKVTLSNTAQYNNLSRQVSVSSIFRWHLHPGSNLYLVWHHDVPIITTSDPTGLNVSSGNEMTVKMAWTFS